MKSCKNTLLAEYYHANQLLIWIIPSLLFIICFPPFKHNDLKFKQIFFYDSWKLLHDFNISIISQLPIYVFFPSATLALDCTITSISWAMAFSRIQLPATVTWSFQSLLLPHLLKFLVKSRHSVKLCKIYNSQYTFLRVRRGNYKVSILYGHWFLSWLLCFESSSLLIVWEQQ